MNKPINIVSISGGKDSTALRLLALEKGVEHIAVFADTGHESQTTYDYLDYLESVTGPIKRVRADFSMQLKRKRRYIAMKWELEGVSRERISRAIALLSKPTGNPFLDLCLWKGRFPSTRVRFCSQELKHVPIFEQVVDPLLESGHEVVSWQGVRADESGPRAKLSPIEEVGDGLWNYRPILYWTAEEVFAMHRKHGVDPNPLYLQGMGRVGCMPCIHAGKDELRQIAMRFPEEVERVAEWEDLVAATSKRGEASLFAADKTPGWVRGSKPSAQDLDRFRIAHVVEWAKTGRGGRQRDMLLDEEEPSLCSSIYGLCE